MTNFISRRTLIKRTGLGLVGLGVAGTAKGAEEPIPGMEEVEETANRGKKWQPVSDRKIRVGIAGYGFCRFGAAFGFQKHPNVEVVAVTDLIPDRCAGLAKACHCSKTYPSIEEMVKDDKIEAVFVATDAPSHANHCILALEHGKHVATAVPVSFGSIEDAERVFEAVKKAQDLNYMMFETSTYHPDLYAMRQLYGSGRFGKVVYSEGRYYHDKCARLGSYKDWRIGMPPQWYPTHSNAYYNAVTDGSFTEVCCMGMPSIYSELQPRNNRYKNPFGTEIALFRTSEGGMSRMGVTWDTPGGHHYGGSIRGQKSSFENRFAADNKGFSGDAKGIDLERAALPPGVSAGGHGGSHGHLTNEFVLSLLEDRKPLVNDIIMSLNMTVSGIVAHQSAMRDGELLKIPQYAL
jgi:GFO/IDH/MocA oxidoreductase family protein